MAREGLMDDTGYHGFDECSNWENCTSAAYLDGFADGEKAERERWIDVLKRTFTNMSLIQSIEKEVDMYDKYSEGI